MTRLHIAGALAAIWLVSPPWSSQQRDASGAPPPTRGTSSIAGIVTTNDSPMRPLRRVTVTLTELINSAAGRIVVTDDAGRFIARDLAAGRYRISAEKAPYLTTSYGATRVPRPSALTTGTAVAVAEGQSVSDVAIVMHRGGVISGVLRDTSGNPAAGTFVGALYFTRSSTTGERTLSLYRGSFLRVEADDRGLYRLYGLPPGDYVMVATSNASRDIQPTTDDEVARALALIQRPTASVTPGDSGSPPKRQTVGVAPVYYPGTPIAANATTITLAAGEERTGIDFQVQFVRTAHIEGTLTNADGTPAPATPMRLVSHAPSLGPLDVAGLIGGMATTDANGHFSLAGITPGSYTLTVRGAIPAGARGGGRGMAAVAPPTHYALADVIVQGDDVRVDLQLQEGLPLSGQLRFDAVDAAPPQDLSRVRVSLSAVLQGQTATLGVPAVSADAAGRFTFTGVVPGRYQLSATAPAATPGQPTWFVKSATANGQDALEGSFEVAPGQKIEDALITLTDRTTEINGTMFDRAGQPAPEYYILAFSADSKYWVPRTRRIQQTRPGRDGKFAFKNLPPGDYLIAAVTDVDQNEWLDPEYLKQLVPASIKVSLAEGEKKTQDIRVR